MSVDKSISFLNRIRVTVNRDVVGTIPEDCISSSDRLMCQRYESHVVSVRIAGSMFRASCYAGLISEILARSLAEAERLPGFRGLTPVHDGEVPDNAHYRRSILDIRSGNIRPVPVRKPTC